jgi:hypothetical protein
MVEFFPLILRQSFDELRTGSYLSLQGREDFEIPLAPFPKGGILDS